MNIVVYFARSIQGQKNEMLFEDALKWPIYKHFFQRLSELGFSVYLGSFQDHYRGSSLFENPMRFDGETFSPSASSVRADLLFDRSFSSHIPPEELSHKVFNAVSFKNLCGNKERTHELLGSLMPKSFTLSNKRDFQNILQNMPFDQLCVAKPVFGIKGKGIQIDIPSEIVVPEKSYPYLLQEFIDTTQGVPGLAQSVHDLRFISANGKIILAALRIPAPGSLLANVAQGGSIEEIPLAKIPEDILQTVHEVHSQVESRYPGSCYSMDFGYDKVRKRVFLFELNDRVGFPRPSMPNALQFTEELALSILAFSKTLT